MFKTTSDKVKKTGFQLCCCCFSIEGCWIGVCFFAAAAAAAAAAVASGTENGFKEGRRNAESVSGNGVGGGLFSPLAIIEVVFFAVFESESEWVIFLLFFFLT